MAPLLVGGDRLVEGCGIVEVPDSHLRIIVGDPAYGGRTWRSRGLWYEGWRRWWGFEHQYAYSWYQKLTRTVDPGFHSLRLNSLAIEQIGAPRERASLIFEVEIILEHEVGANVLRQIQVNGVDVAHQWALQDRWLPLQRSLFGIRSMFNSARSKVSLRQF
jgi:hypothetical protein